MVRLMEVLLVEEWGEGFGCMHVSETGLAAAAVAASVGEVESNDEACGILSYLVVLIRALFLTYRHRLPHDSIKAVVVVMRTWSCHWSPHIVERLIIELRITAVSPYYYILLFLLYRV